MAKLPVNELIEKAAAELQRVWESKPAVRDRKKSIPVEIEEAVKRSISSRTKSYRYVLPTQTLAKIVDPQLDARSLQEGSSLVGSFDARSLCHAVVVPFDRKNHNVLGGAPEPYVNNPLRIPSIQAEHRSAQKNKAGFDDLCRVVDFLQEHPSHAHELLGVIAHAIRERLAIVHVVYPAPNRPSLKKALHAVSSFLAERTGGTRLQAVAVALFRTIGEVFQLFEQVETASVNAADAATGSVADLSCKDAKGNVVLAVEVKDREVRLRHIEDKLPAVREQGIRELLFLTTVDVATEEAESVSETIDREFATGQNVYVISFDRILSSCLTLFGELGRRRFLVQVGTVLDEVKADLSHREKWRELLQRI